MSERAAVDREALIQTAANALYHDRWDGDPTEGQFAGERFDDAEQQATVAVDAVLALVGGKPQLDCNCDHVARGDDLADWLTQIWDELEATAREAYYEGQVWLPEEESVITAPDWDVVYTADRKVDASHIAEWSPASVLARIAADRQILAAWMDSEPARYPDWFGGYAAALEQVVKLQASAYADRPGYQEDWKPLPAGVARTGRRMDT